MLLQKHGHYNDLSPQLRKELENRVAELGKVIRFRFHIEHDNPDPEKYNGPKVWPFLYTLDPRTFRINDPYEKREGVSKSKEIGLVEKMDAEGKRVERFDRVRINERHKGVLTFRPEDNDLDKDFVMYLLLHPKLKGGKFADKNRQQMIELLDERKEAQLARELRSARAKARAVAEKMSDAEIIQFADANMWDSTEDIEVLRNRVEIVAEDTPQFFNDLVEGKNLEYQALIKQAMDRQVIGFDPVEYRYIWFDTQQLITILSPVGDKNEIQKFSDWLQTGGAKAEEVYKKIKGLTNR